MPDGDHEWPGARKPDDTGVGAAASRDTTANASLELGTCLETQGKVEEALVVFQQATELAPENARAFYYLGGVLQRLGRCEESAHAYRRSAELAPDHWVTQLKFGKVLRELKQYEEAIRVL